MRIMPIRGRSQSLASLLIANRLAKPWLPSSELAANAGGTHSIDCGCLPGIPRMLQRTPHAQAPSYRPRDGRRVNGKETAGQLVVLYGTSTGVSSAKRTVLSQNSAGVPGTAEAKDAFGGETAVLWGSASGITGTGVPGAR
jgi:hypothetical protein